MLRQIVLIGIVLVALIGGSGIATADSHHKACPDDNPGEGLEQSVTASEGTSLLNALDGITKAMHSVECDGSFEP